METKRLRASVVCQARGTHLLVVRLRDPITGVERIFPPGGALEANETPADAARRETLEESGLRVRIAEDAKAVVDTYPFRWADVDHDVTTHYFAATSSPLDGEDVDVDAPLPKVIDADYNLGASWMPTHDAIEAMSTQTQCAPIAKAVARVVRETNRAGWLKHRNVGGPAGTLLHIHDQFRVASERLTLMVDREDDLAWVVRRGFEPLAQVLHHHHHAEEIMLFPMVLRRTGIAPERLVTDHQTLTRAISDVEALVNERDRTNAQATIARFNDVLITHLDREESLVIPVLLEMSPHEAWSLIHGQ